MNSVTARSPLSQLSSQSLTQPNPIKWLLMNFKQVLSPSSTCAMLHPPPPSSSIRAGAHLICAPSFHPLSSCLFDMLKLLLSHALKGIFCLFQLLRSFVVPLSHFAFLLPLSIYNSLAKKHETFRKVLEEALFSIYYLYPASTTSPPFASACQSLSRSLAFFYFSSTPPLVLSRLLCCPFLCPCLLISLLPLLFQESHVCSIFSQLLTPELIGC